MGSYLFDADPELDQSQEFTDSQARLADNRAEGTWVQVTGVHGHRHEQIAFLELKMAAPLADLVEACLFQSSNYLSRLERGQFRHRRELLC